MLKATFLVKPNARSNSFGKDAEGNLWVRIAAPPTEGKANKALISFFSDLLGISKSAIQLTGGSLGRHKTFSFDTKAIDWDQVISQQEISRHT